MAKIDIKSLSLKQLEGYLTECKQPKFRAKQIYSWLHQKLVTSFSQMTNLPKSLIAVLEEMKALKE